MAAGVSGSGANAESSSVNAVKVRYLLESLGVVISNWGSGDFSRWSLSIFGLDFLSGD